MSASLESRIGKASEVLAIKDFPKEQIQKLISEALEKIGVDDSAIGIQVLEAETTEFTDFYRIFELGEISKNGIVTKIQGQIPTPRVKLAWEILKGTPAKKSESNPKELYAALRPIGQWSDVELLEKYSKDCSDDIGETLKKRSKDRYVIVFNEDESVDVEHSLYMLRLAKMQETFRTTEINGETKEVFRIGEFPKEYFFECPVHTNILLVGGYCEECGTSWDHAANYERNVFIRLIKDEVPDIRPYRSKSIDELKKDFPKIFLKFKELKELNQLPSMKRKVSRGRQGDPFRVVETSHRTY